MQGQGLKQDHIQQGGQNNSCGTSNPLNPNIHGRVGLVRAVRGCAVGEERECVGAVPLLGLVRAVRGCAVGEERRFDGKESRSDGKERVRPSPPASQARPRPSLPASQGRPRFADLVLPFSDWRRWRGKRDRGTGGKRER